MEKLWFWPNTSAFGRPLLQGITFSDGHPNASLSMDLGRKLDASM